jgi:hypothetical protein
VSGVLLVLAALPGSLAAADPAPAPPAGPSLRETGRVGQIGVSGQGAQIQQLPPERSAPRELTVTAAKERVERPAAAAPQGVIDPVLLERQIQARFGALNACPADVARRRHLAPGTLRAKQLTLRWTILPTGQVAETAVVAASPVHVEVMDCVKRQMGRWSFARPRGGSVRLERAFTFHPPRPPARDRV